MLREIEFSQANDYPSIPTITDSELSSDKSTLIQKGYEIYSMNRNEESWIEFKPPIEVRNDDFIVRPKSMIENHPYRFEFQSEEVFAIKRPDGKITVFNLREG